jgi:DNA invertase Pin-like site-specific DNA recombinase
MKEAIAYYRVSTKRQEKSGLGLEAQREAVKRYMQANNITIVREFFETESGRKSNRPILMKAVRACKRRGAILIIAKVDRLARNVLLVARLIEANVKIVAADKPWLTTTGMLQEAIDAEREGDTMRIRTTESLQAAKARGVQLGKYGKTLAVENKKKADLFAKELQPILLALMAEGFTSLRRIASELNKRKVPTFRPAGRWHKNSIHNIFERLKMSIYDYKTLS